MVFEHQTKGLGCSPLEGEPNCACSSVKVFVQNFVRDLVGGISRKTPIQDYVTSLYPPPNLIRVTSLFKFNARAGESDLAPPQGGSTSSLAYEIYHNTVGGLVA
jgi:hypothetical protein